MAEYYPPAGFYFSVKIPDASNNADVAFNEVSGLSAEMGTEEIAEGGENRFKYRVPTVTKYNNLVLKRGLVAPTSELATWVLETLGNGLSEPLKPRTIIVLLLNPEGQEMMSWNVVNAWPLKMNISEFKANENALVIETMEFGFTYFQRVK